MSDARHGRVSGRAAEVYDAARGRAPALEWRAGAAEALPFDDVTFAAVVSQFGLMIDDDGTDGTIEFVSLAHIVTATKQ